MYITTVLIFIFIVLFNCFHNITFFFQISVYKTLLFVRIQLRNQIDKYCLVWTAFHTLTHSKLINRSYRLFLKVCR